MSFQVSVFLHLKCSLGTISILKIIDIYYFVAFRRYLWLPSSNSNVISVTFLAEFEPFSNEGTRYVGDDIRRCVECGWAGKSLFSCAFVRLKEPCDV